MIRSSVQESVSSERACLSRAVSCSCEERPLYKKRDLTFAKEKAAEELERLSTQEAIVNNSSAQGISVKPDNELLIHLYDLNRRMIDRVKRIEAALDAKP